MNHHNKTGSDQPDTVVHPDDMALQRYRAGLLEASEQLRTQWHIAACTHCQQELSRYERLDVVLHQVGVQLREQQLPEALQQSLLTSVLEAQRLRALSPRSEQALALTPPDRVAGVLGSLVSLGLAGGLLVWPWLRELDVVSLEVATYLRQVAVLQRGFQTLSLMAADHQVFLWAPALVTTSLSVMVLSRLARRRLHFNLSF